MTRAGATFDVGGTPWARARLNSDPERWAALGQRAIEVRASVSILGKSASGPWVVRVGDNGIRVLTFRGHDLFELVEFGLERWAAGADDAGIRWTAGADHLAHAHPGRGRAIWTLCKLAAVDERMAHPERSRCADCWRALDRDVATAARGAA